MNKNITISVEEYKELLLKERPSDNDKWLLGKIKEFVVSQCKLSDTNNITVVDRYSFGEDFVKFIKTLDREFYKEIVKKAYDEKISDEENKLKMEKLRALKEANKEVTKR